MNLQKSFLALAVLILTAAGVGLIGLALIDPLPVESARSNPASPLPALPLIPSPTPANGRGPDGLYRVYLPQVVTEPLPPLGSLIDRWITLVDDSQVAYRTVPRQYHPFQKSPLNPVLKADRPWEGQVVQLYGSVLPGFRMWYSGWNEEEDLKQILYAESRDGLNWEKPALDSQGRNILLDGAEGEIPSLFSTPHDWGNPFKLLVYQTNYQSYTSPNGLQFQGAGRAYPLFFGEDVAHAFWDARSQLYIGTAKENRPVRKVDRRVIRFFTSPDLEEWTDRPDVLAPDDTDERLAGKLIPHFYGMPIFPSGQGYLGLLWVLNATDKAGLFGQVHIQLASSPDGVHWIREEGDRPPILDVGAPGEWDAGQIYTANAPVRVGDELWLYYSGCNLEHGSSLKNMYCSIGLATAPVNRLASLSGTGMVDSYPLYPHGPELLLNYDAQNGSLRVELLRDGQPIPGYALEDSDPLNRTSLNATATWRGQSRLPEGPFQVRFHLQNADLYAFTLGDP